MSDIFPLPDAIVRKASELSRWQPGSVKPSRNGLYLREFDDGVFLSEFHNGSWRYDGFFESDIQDCRWRGLRKPANEVTE